MTNHYLDPVCGMRVESDKISTIHDGTRHVFCSTHCRERFLADPIPFLLSHASDPEQGSGGVRHE